MKLGIYSHCAIDTIKLNDTTNERIGGAACYAGITARHLKSDVFLVTKFGKDFPAKEYLDENKLHHDNSLSEKNSTRFRIEIQGADRELFLENSCDALDYQELDVDGILISPIFDEISLELFDKIKNNSDFVFLDPQGFLRRTDNNHKVFLEKTDLNLSGIDAIKVGIDEMQKLVGGNDVDSMKKLQSGGVKHVLCTNREEISMLVDDRIYSLTLPNKKINDTTGIGDIFSSTFSCTMLKEKDFLWAFCFAGGAAQAALDSKDIGLQKIPKKGSIETNASYFYNTIKFRHV